MLDVAFLSPKIGGTGSNCCSEQNLEPGFLYKNSLIQPPFSHCIVVSFPIQIQTLISVLK